jgi:hypothetical protein
MPRPVCVPPEVVFSTDCDIAVIVIDTPQEVLLNAVSVDKRIRAGSQPEAVIVVVYEAVVDRRCGEIVPIVALNVIVKGARIYLRSGVGIYVDAALCKFDIRVGKHSRAFRVEDQIIPT